MLRLNKIFFVCALSVLLCVFPSFKVHAQNKVDDPADMVHAYDSSPELVKDTATVIYAEITEPVQYAKVGIVPILGSAWVSIAPLDTVVFDHYTLTCYDLLGTPYSQFRSNKEVRNDTLAVWDASLKPTGNYILGLKVFTSRGDSLVKFKKIALVRATDISYDGMWTAQNMELFQNVPNPCSIKTSISFFINRPGNSTLKIYSITGHIVATIFEGDLSQGEHTFKFDGNKLPNGIYIYKLSVAGKSVQKKMLIQR